VLRLALSVSQEIVNSKIVGLEELKHGNFGSVASGLVVSFLAHFYTRVSVLNDAIDNDISNGFRHLIEAFALVVALISGVEGSNGHIVLCKSGSLTSADVLNIPETLD